MWALVRMLYYTDLLLDSRGVVKVLELLLHDVTVVEGVNDAELVLGWALLVALVVSAVDVLALCQLYSRVCRRHWLMLVNVVCGAAVLLNFLNAARLGDSSLNVPNHSMVSICSTTLWTLVKKSVLMSISLLFSIFKA